MSMNYTQKKRLTNGLFYILYVAIALIFLAPLVFLFVSSVKEETQLISDMSTICIKC